MNVAVLAVVSVFTVVIGVLVSFIRPFVRQLMHYGPDAARVVADLRDKSGVLGEAPDTERNRATYMEVENRVNRPGVRRHVYSEIAKMKADRIADAYGMCDDSGGGGCGIVMGSEGIDIMGNQYASIHDPALTALGIFANDIM